MNFPFPHGFMAGAGLDPNVWYGFNDRVGAIATWSPTDKNARLNLTNSNLTVSSGDSSTHKLIRATNPIVPSAGKTYWEFVLGGNGPGASNYVTILGQMIGGTSVADGSIVSGQGQGCAQGYATDAGSSYVNGWTSTVGAAIGNVTYAFAYDSIAGKMWFGSGAGWNGVSIGNPMTNGAASFTRTAAAALMFPAVSFLTTVNVTAVFDAASFTSPLCSIVGPRQGDSFTKLLLHCDGKSGSSCFPDRSQSTHFMTGGATIASSGQKFGNGCVYFNGTSLFVSSDPNNDLIFGTGDFTIDFWFKPSAGYASGVTLADWQPPGGGAYPTIAVNTSGQITYWTNGNYRITGTTVISANVWYHLALARAGTNTKLFLNGVQEGPTYTDTQNYVNPGINNRPLFGVWGTDGVTWPFNGWMDEIRVSKGIARWTANFTPPTAPYT